MRYRSGEVVFCALVALYPPPFAFYKHLKMNNLRINYLQV